MAKHGIKITDEILDFNTVEDFTLIRAEYKQKQQVRFYCAKCNEPVVRTVERIQSLISHNQFTHLCRNCQRKDTSQKLYGCDFPAQSQQAKDKSKQTRLEKFGGWNSDKQREAITKVFEERKDEIVAKREHTCLEKAGVTNMNKTKETRDKIKQTCLEHFGTTSSLAAESVKEKIKQTLLEKTGYATAHESPEAIQKTKDTCKDKYGATSYFASEAGKEKIKQTFLEKYGVENPSQIVEIQKKKARKYFYENQYFDSSWELAVWIYAKDHNEEIIREPYTLNYYYEGQLHKYYPDFLYNGKLTEVKGEQFFKKDGTIRNPYKRKLEDVTDKQIIEKFKCMKDHNVEILNRPKMQKFLKYIKNVYGRNYLQQFRVKK